MLFVFDIILHNCVYCAISVLHENRDVRRSRCFRAAISVNLPLASKTMKKLLLLNPPFRKELVLRDYYCSHISKGSYCWPPLDLLVLSGLLKGHCDIKIVDAVAQRFSFDEARKIVGLFAPDYIISLVGSASWGNDMDFLSSLKRICGAFIIVSGDYPKAKPKETIRGYSFIDAVLLDFSESDILDLIAVKKRKNLINILTREDGDNFIGISSKEFSFPVPMHEEFPLRHYHLPQLLYHPAVSIITDFGCLFSCTFCPFERIAHKLRRVDNIAEELEYLYKIGIKELWLRNQSFGSVKGHALDFCKLLKKFGRHFSWSCEIRVDNAGEDLLRQMKESGCHTVMFGVETAQESILRAHNKYITMRNIRDAFSLAKDLGMDRLGHFIIGLNGETLQSQLELIDLALSLNPEYAAFNIATPLWGTTFMDMALREGKISDKDIELDSSCSYPIWEGDYLKKSDVWQLREMAIKRFYSRFSYVLFQLQNMKTGYRMYSFLREGINLLLSGLRRRRG